MADQAMLEMVARAVRDACQSFNSESRVGGRDRPFGERVKLLSEIGDETADQIIALFAEVEGWSEPHDFEFELECDGDIVAGAASPNRLSALSEINHYAGQYTSEGECRVFEVRRLRRPMLAAAPTLKEKMDG